MDNIIVRKACGYALVVISCYFSVKLMSQFAVAGLDKIVWGFLGIVFMISEFLFSSAGVRAFFERRFVVCVGCVFFWIMLYVISVVGSVGFESATTHDAKMTAGKTDRNLERFENELRSIESSIKTTEQQITDMIGKSLMTKGVMPAKAELEKLREEKKALLKKIETWQPEAGGANQFWTELAKFVGNDASPDSVRFSVFLLIALLIDAIGSFLLVLDFNPADIIPGRPQGKKSVNVNPVQREIGHQPTGSAEGDPVHRRDTMPTMPHGKLAGLPVGKEQDMALKELSARIERLDRIEQQTQQALLERIAVLERDRTLDSQMFQSPVATKPVDRAIAESGIKQKSVGTLDSQMFSKPVATEVESKIESDMIKQKSEPLKTLDSQGGSSPVATVATEVEPKQALKTVGTLDSQSVQSPVATVATVATDIDKGLIRKYIDALYPAKKNGSLTGRGAIADRIDIDNREAHNVHKMLKNKGLIRVVGTKTLAVHTDKNELLKRLNILT